MNSPFTITENEDGISLSEDGKPVFFYQKKPKSLTGKYICNNYIHPLYNLNGDTLTEEFPADHLFHRGVFWAWHQLKVNDTINLGDGWINEGISQEVISRESQRDKDEISVTTQVQWNSLALPEGEEFMEEMTTITVYRKKNEMRIIDFAIILNPKIEGIKIGGSDDEKGYGGFSVRLKLPEDIAFASETGAVEPQNLQIKTGPVMDFSGTFGKSGKNGVLLLCHPENPGYPSPWILRRKGSMQNIAFPGRELFNLDKPLVLRYRMIIHSGDVESVRINELREEYCK